MIYKYMYGGGELLLSYPSFFQFFKIYFAMKMRKTEDAAVYWNTHEYMVCEVKECVQL